ncbi:MAG: cysteine--tRNA ligase [Candidatus Hydrogenedentes bacterium]|nr:cysteine--tRNA ligase [Candidatus Hydrogenedentota bacterium]
MSQLRFNNSMTRRIEPFEPVYPNEVRMYTCGPTVYDFAHIGNFRAYLFEDLLRRYLKFRGYKVTQVMNLTDIDDKTIRGAKEAGVPIREWTQRYKDAFFEDLDTLNIERAEHYPAATDHIDDMVELVKRLKDNGHTYEANGSIYFKISTFPEYGKLAHIEAKELEAGASGRIDADEYEKEDVRDFALWKAWTETDGETFWDTELGRGRPGWHIECSAMAMRYLGETLDIHTGGVDNLFPHHENEIAQSEAATGKPFVRYWMHCAHLLVDNRKMSKSLGNFYTLRDLVERGYDPIAIRYALISTHYRQPCNFTFAGLDAAASAVRRLRELRVRLKECRGDGESPVSAIEDTRNRFTESMDDDLNISPALAAVFDFAREINRRIDAAELSPDGAAQTLAFLDEIDTVLGVMAETETDVPQDILDMVEQRQAARRDKNFALSDELRDRIAAAGYTVEDTPDGPRVKKS